MSGAARVLERCEVLGQVSEEPGRLTRRFGTPAMARANELVGGWMHEAGLATREDAVGNLIGRRGDGPVLVLGSHLDTVVDAGRYDGPLGVLVALEAVERVPRAVHPVHLEALLRQPQRVPAAAAGDVEHAPAGRKQ